MPLNHFTFKIGGPAGYGIKSTGLMFAKACFKGGLNVFDYSEYPSLIRGGHNTYTVSASGETIYAVDEGVDILVALDADTINLHHHELTNGAGVLYDDELVHFDTKVCKQPTIHCFPVPFIKIAKESGGTKQMLNVASLGATVAIIGYDLSVLLSLIEEQFGGKGGAVVEMNKKVAENAYAYAKEHYTEPFHHTLKKIGKKENRVYITGNDAISLGAVASGMKCYIAYPMTPSSPILEFMAGKAKKYGLVVKQMEDEIAVINAAIGASQAGARTMIGTSGGGFSLMVEGLGFAAMTETPLVIVEGQRPGPSTGLPTWTEQGDILFIAHASQGDFPRVILAPGDPEEAFYLTAEAHNLAEKYQLPVFILSDKHLSESSFTISTPNQTKIDIDRGKMLTDREAASEKEYKRYALTSDGVSPRTIPGEPGGMFCANSDEHNEYGFTDETQENRIAMMDKRFRKLVKLERELPRAKIHGQKDALITFISAGSTKNAILEAVAILKKQGHSANFIQLLSIQPFVDKELLEKILSDTGSTSIIIENNKTGQLSRLIREETGKSPDFKLLKYDGRQFFPTEIVRAVLAMR